MTGEYILTYEALSNEDCTLYFIAVSTLGVPCILLLLVLWVPYF